MGATPCFWADTDDWLRARQRGACAAKRTVSDDMDALLPAVVDNVLLRQGRVVLNLVDRRKNLAVGDELLEVTLTVLINNKGARTQ